MAEGGALSAPTGPAGDEVDPTDASEGVGLAGLKGNALGVATSTGAGVLVAGRITVPVDRLPALSTI